MNSEGNNTIRFHLNILVILFIVGWALFLVTMALLVFQGSDRRELANERRRDICTEVEKVKTILRQEDQKSYDDRFTTLKLLDIPQNTPRGQQTLLVIEQNHARKQSAYKPRRCG